MAHMVGSLRLPAVHTSLGAPPPRPRLTLSLTGSSGKPLSCRPWVAAAGCCRGASTQRSHTLGAAPAPPCPERGFPSGCGSQRCPRPPWQREERPPGQSPHPPEPMWSPWAVWMRGRVSAQAPLVLYSASGRGSRGMAPWGLPCPASAQRPVLPVTLHPRLLLLARV